MPWLQRAMDEMEGADAVLGPAVDGGFYLVSARKTHETMFRGVQWSTDSVLEATATSLGALGWSCCMDLPVLQDIGACGAAPPTVAISARKNPRNPSPPQIAPTGGPRILVSRAARGLETSDPDSSPSSLVPADTIDDLRAWCRDAGSGTGQLVEVCREIADMSDSESTQHVASAWA